MDSDDKKGVVSVEDFRYELQWPRDNLFVDCFAHEIMNYRYHWHQEEYELNILLHGSQEFCRETDNILLEEDDVLLVNPGTGHASFAQQPNTRALVIHFSAAAFRPYVKKGCILHFSGCCPPDDPRDDVTKRMIRLYAAQVYRAACQGGPYARLSAKAGMEQLMAVLCARSAPREVKAMPEQEEQQELVRRLIGYIEAHYAEKLTLEDLASFSQYNRTYISTLFKNTVGVNFYEYLTRLRFQCALLDMSGSAASLTDIALSNGFADLKSFSKRFRETFGRSPAEYRALLTEGRILGRERRFISPADKIVARKLDLYLSAFDC